MVSSPVNNSGVTAPAEGHLRSRPTWDRRGACEDLGAVRGVPALTLLAGGTCAALATSAAMSSREPPGGGGAQDGVRTRVGPGLKEDGTQPQCPGI